LDRIGSISIPENEAVASEIVGFDDWMPSNSDYGELTISIIYAWDLVLLNPIRVNCLDNNATYVREETLGRDVVVKRKVQSRYMRVPPTRGRECYKGAYDSIVK
jgi:hypothetical protein